MRVIFLIFTLFISNAYAKGIVGQVAPEINDVSWFDTKNKKISIPSIKEHKGKVVILKFWQSWCPGCLNKGLPDLKTLQSAFKNNDKVKIYSAQTVFEGHSINTQKKIKQIRDKFNLTIPIAHDDGKSHNVKSSVLMKRYQSRGTPWYVIIGRDGKVVFNDFHLDPQKVISSIKKRISKK